MGGDFREAVLQLSGQCAVLLGWRPDDFWSATPAELATVLTAFAPHEAVPPDSATFTRLMEQFPDG